MADNNVSNDISFDENNQNKENYEKEVEEKELEVDNNMAIEDTNITILLPEEEKDDHISTSSTEDENIAVLLTQPRNETRTTATTLEGTTTGSELSRTILFQSDDEDNSSPSVMTRFGGYQELDPRDVEQNRIESSYIDRLYNSSDLVIANPKSAQKSFQKKGPLGLLHLFIPANFIDSYMMNATQQVLNEKEASRGKKVTLTVPKLHCVLGLDIAMSLCNSTTMKELWSKKMFLGSSSFSECMSRDEFITIRGSLRIHSKSCAKDPYDPLWSCRPLLSIILRNAATIAHPVGVISLDEASCPTKARTRGKTYNPSKPDKFAFRFYSLNGWRYVYTYSLWDNGAGNTLPNSPAQRFLGVFGELQASFNMMCSVVASRIKNCCPILADTATMLWVLMMGLLFRQMKGEGGTNEVNNPKNVVVFMDNYYTRHPLAKAISSYTDDTIKVTGTVKMNLVDKINKIAVTKALKSLSGKPRGYWVLVRAYNAVVHPSKKKQKEHVQKVKKISDSLIRMTSGFEESDILLVANELCVTAPKTGYIVWLDSKPVVLYTNDLVDTPKEELSNDDHAKKCVHGLATVYRWAGESFHNRQEFKVPAPIVAYNIFMNGVDRADQMRASNACRRKEQRISITIWHFLLDIMILNAYQVYLKLLHMGLVMGEGSNLNGPSQKAMSLREFKRQLAESLCKKNHEVYSATKKRSQTASILNTSTNKRGRPRLSRTPPSAAVARLQTPIADADDEVGNVPRLSGFGDLASHILAPNRFPGDDDKKRTEHRRKRSTCYLCKIVYGDSITGCLSTYGCVDCQRPFHVECFSLYHNSGKCAMFNKKCKEIHDRIQEHFSSYPEEMYGVDATPPEYLETPSSRSRKRQKTITCYPKEVSMFGQS